MKASKESKNQNGETRDAFVTRQVASLTHFHRGVLFFRAVQTTCYLDLCVNCNALFYWSERKINGVEVFSLFFFISLHEILSTILTFLRSHHISSRLYFAYSFSVSAIRPFHCCTHIPSAFSMRLWMRPEACETHKLLSKRTQQKKTNLQNDSFNTKCTRNIWMDIYILCQHWEQQAIYIVVADNTNMNFP